MEHRNKMKLQTAINAVLAVCVSVIGFFMIHTLQAIEAKQKELSDKFDRQAMPRTEITLRLEELSSHDQDRKIEMAKLANEQTDTRLRLVKLELEVSGLIALGKHP